MFVKMGKPIHAFAAYQRSREQEFPNVEYCNQWTPFALIRAHQYALFKGFFTPQS